MVSVIVVTMALVFNHYLFIRDLSVLFVQKTMINKQQTQLRQFIINSSDPVLILGQQSTGEFELKLCNPAADKVFPYQKK